MIFQQMLFSQCYTIIIIMRFGNERNTTFYSGPRSCKIAIKSIKKKDTQIEEIVNKLALTHIDSFCRHPNPPTLRAKLRNRPHILVYKRQPRYYVGLKRIIYNARCPTLLFAFFIGAKPENNVMVLLSKGVWPNPSLDC